MLGETSSGEEEVPGGAAQSEIEIDEKKMNQRRPSSNLKVKLAVMAGIFSLHNG